MAQDRTEAPTKRRIEDARKRGQVAHSKEVDTALAMLAAFGVMRLTGQHSWDAMRALMTDSFAVLERDDIATVDLTSAVGLDLVLRGLVILMPLFGAVIAVSLLGGFLQTGFVFSTQALTPKLSKLNPITGAKRVFLSKQTAVEVVKSLIKTVVVGGVAFLAMRARLDELAGLGLTTGILPALGIAVDITFDVVFKVCLALFVVAGFDYAFQRWNWFTELRMTRQEVRDEMRQTDGDPQVRQRIARLRRSLLTRVLAAVPQADVVLTNPTHYAVALKYDPTSDRAPRVIAKGERLVALRIREKALESGVPIIENPPLTRAIYRAVPVNREITPELYEAVAEVLAFVYRLRLGRRAVAA